MKDDFNKQSGYQDKNKTRNEYEKGQAGQDQGRGGTQKGPQNPRDDKGKGNPHR